MKRTERVTVLFTPKEKQYIVRRAALEHRTLSDHIRHMYLSQVHKDEEVIPSEDQASTKG